jgi:hypothetical protein
LREAEGKLGEQGVAFDVAMLAETGGDGIEVDVVVAGMADEFEGARRWKGGEELGEGGGVELAGGGDADAAVGGFDCSVGNLGVGPELGFEAAEEFELELAHQAAVVEGAGPGRLEGVADGGDGGTLGDAEERSGDLGEEVGVFVGVEVGDGDAGALELLDLGEGLDGDLFFVDLAAKEGQDEAGQFRAKGAAVGAEEGGDGIGGGDGDAVGEDDVAADAEGGMGEGEGDGVVEGEAVGHEGGGGEDAAQVEFKDGAIDAEGEAEVVGVEDEAGGHASSSVKAGRSCAEKVRKASAAAYRRAIEKAKWRFLR